MILAGFLNDLTLASLERIEYLYRLSTCHRSKGNLQIGKPEKLCTFFRLLSEKCAQHIWRENSHFAVKQLSSRRCAPVFSLVHPTVCTVVHIFPGCRKEEIFYLNYLVQRQRAPITHTHSDQRRENLGERSE